MVVQETELPITESAEVAALLVAVAAVAVMVPIIFLMELAPPAAMTVG
jgi:hypothetical protein